MTTFIPPALWRSFFILCPPLTLFVLLRLLLPLAFRKSAKIPPSYPGRGRPSFLRNALDFVTDQIGTVLAATEECGNIFSIQILTVYNVWLRGNALNKYYLHTREEVWSFVGGMGVFLNKIIDKGYWNNYRVLLASVSRYINRAAAQENAIRITIQETQKRATEWGSNQQGFMLFDSMSRMVHGIIVRSLMGEDFYRDSAQELLQLLHAMEADLGSPLSFILPDWVPHPPARRLERARNRIKEIFYERLREREAAAVATAIAMKDQDRRVDAKMEDYVTFTLCDKLTAPLKDLMPSHHTLLMFAAHTSTAASIAWNVIELLRHPHMMKRVTDELRSNPDANDSLVLQACIKETSRCYSGMRLLRLARQDILLPEAGHHIPKGSIVSISPYLTHRDPHNFPSPDEWLPERWIKEGKMVEQVNTLNNDGVYFMPFGAGSHRCVGEKLARIMVSYSLMTLLREWDVGWADGEVAANTNFGDLNFDKVGTPWLRGDVSIRVKEKRRLT